jgi:hypothetical protein
MKCEDRAIIEDLVRTREEPAGGDGATKPWIAEEPSVAARRDDFLSGRDSVRPVHGWGRFLEREIVRRDLFVTCLVALGSLWTRATTEKLHVAGDDMRQFALASLLVGELPSLQPSLDIEGLAFGHVLCGDLGEPAEADDGVVLALPWVSRCCP